MKKHMKIISIAFVVIAVLAVFFLTRFYSIYGNRIEVISVGNEKIYAETVSSDKKMQKGLGGRGGMCVRCAMLFDFQKPGKYGFWMKNMEFPLDIIWILQGKIVHIEKNIQQSFVGTLGTNEDADMVLEMNAGKADELGMEVGDMISF